jgi:hypothetical protein
LRFHTPIINGHSTEYCCPFGLKAIAKELRDLGWVKDDYSDRIDKYIDFAFLAKVTGQPPARLSTW